MNIHFTCYYFSPLVISGEKHDFNSWMHVYYFNSILNKDFNDFSLAYWIQIFKLKQTFQYALRKHKL